MIQWSDLKGVNMKSRDYKQDIYEAILNTDGLLKISDINDYITATFGYRLDVFSVLGYLQELQREDRVIFRDGGYTAALPTSEHDGLIL